MISFALEEDQQLIKETVHKFAAEVVRPNMRPWEAAGAVPKEAQQAFFELGLWGLDVDRPDWDGTEGALLTAAIVHEELAWGDAGAAVALWGPHAAGQALLCLAERDQAERLFAPFTASDAASRRGAIALSEPHRDLITSARPCPGGYVLSGRKSFVINAAQAELTIVFAELAGELAAFAVTGRAGPAGEGSSFRLGERHHLLGLQPAQAGELIFADHFVPEQDRLLGGGQVPQAVQRLLARMALTSAARQVGLMRAAYEYALDYTQERRAFGKPVAHFQAIAFTLADMLMDVESSRWMAWHAASTLEQGQPDPALCAQAAAHANEAAFRVADNCVQLLGGAGYMQDFPAEKWLRDTKALALLHGTDELHGEVIAAAELGHPLQEGGPAALLTLQAAVQPLLT